MEYEKLKTAAKVITMPEDVKRRIVRNCKTELADSGKETTMKKTITTLLFTLLCIFASNAQDYTVEPASGTTVIVIVSPLYASFLLALTSPPVMSSAISTS